MTWTPVMYDLMYKRSINASPRSKKLHNNWADVIGHIMATGALPQVHEDLDQARFSELGLHWLSKATEDPSATLHVFMMVRQTHFAGLLEASRGIEWFADYWGLAWPPTKTA